MLFARYSTCLLILQHIYKQGFIPKGLKQLHFPVQYNVTVIGDNSAFNATLEAGKGNFQVTFSWHPSFGVFIEEIDGIAGGCAYWQLLHNGESSMVGASTLLLAEGDSITWNYNTDYC